ncbi:alpha/beta fold hydrolase [Dyella solisilvae]|uniref:Alpha/beta fold hydrolase n=1 Tax=Dyella solisilvae TaxID=1920168 RepID=A0A370K4V2_9GAMM|nr:alpha/beta hydrolase [Dyella solisilvae]RDI97040.1 alpha/beta fold hydrolase [Dyella solisilvae]
MTRPDHELPFFFGEGGELFGIYHQAARPSARAVLLCAPLGQDHMRCHRIYRQLACTLAGQGMPVLRFDYYGCGDSAGGSAEVDWLRCLDDIAAAARELRARSGAERVLAFGARLGASMALAAAAAAAGIDEVVAWDPVVDGAAFVATQDAMQEAMRQDTHRFVCPRQRAEAVGQWLGFPVSSTLRGQVEGWRAASRVAPSLLLDSMARPAAEWRQLFGEKTRIESLEPTTPWDDLARLEAAVISHPLVQAVASHWRERAYA